MTLSDVLNVNIKKSAKLNLIIHVGFFCKEMAKFIGYHYGENAVNIGQNYFHNEYFRFAQILIMKIMLTDIHGIIIIMS